MVDGQLSMVDSRLSMVDGSAAWDGNTPGGGTSSVLWLSGEKEEGSFRAAVSPKTHESKQAALPQRQFGVSDLITSETTMVKPERLQSADTSSAPLFRSL